MVTQSHAGADGQGVFAVPAAIHCEGRDDVVNNADGFVVVRKSRAGVYAYEFQGPDSLDSDQQAACVDAVGAFITSRDEAEAIEQERGTAAAETALAEEAPAPASEGAGTC